MAEGRKGYSAATIIVAIVVALALGCAIHVSQERGVRDLNERIERYTS